MKFDLDFNSKKNSFASSPPPPPFGFLTTSLNRKRKRKRERDQQERKGKEINKIHKRVRNDVFYKDNCTVSGVGGLVPSRHICQSR